MAKGLAEAVRGLDIDSHIKKIPWEIRLNYQMETMPDFPGLHWSDFQWPVRQMLHRNDSRTNISYDQSDRSTFTQNVSYVGEQISPAEQVRQTQYLIKRLKRSGM